MKKVSITVFGAIFLLALLFMGVWFSPSAKARPPVQQSGSSVGVTVTVGTVPGRCEPTTIIAVPTNTPVYFCLQIRNNSTDTTFTRHIIQYPGNITDVLTLPLAPGEAIALTDNVLESYGLPPRLSIANVTQAIDKSIAVSSTNEVVTVGSAQATARVIIGKMAISVRKTVGVEQGKCATTTALAVAAGTRLYYCLSITNQGTLRIARVFAHDPPLNYFNTLLDRSVITPNTSVAFIFLPFTATQSLTNTMIVTGFTNEGAIVVGESSARLLIGQAQLQVILTSELDPQSCTGLTDRFVTQNTLVYFCITLKNNSTFPLTYHTIKAPNFNLPSLTLTQTIQPGEKWQITEDVLRSLGISNKLTQTVTAAITKIVDVTSKSALGIEATGQGQAKVGFGTPNVFMIAYVSAKQNDCTNLTFLTTTAGAPYYYCLYITNSGTAPLVRHRLVESVANGLRTTFTYTLQPSQKITLTNFFFTSTLKVAPALGPFSATFVTNNSHIVYITSTTASGSAVATSFPININVPQASATPTKAPTQPPTPIPATPTPTLSPTPTSTPTPTLTATSVFVSMLPPPTGNAFVNAVQTPTPVATSPLATPVDPALFTPTPDMNATLAMQAFEATAAQSTADFFATQNALALVTPTPFETPTPMPVESPVAPTPIVTVTIESSAAAPLPQPAQPPSPLAASSAPGQDYMAFLGRVMGVSLVAFGWIWFLVGTLIFFAAAGIFVGLGVRSQARRRYRLEESPDFGLTNDLPAADEVISPQAPTRSAASDDNWPASLP